MIPILIRTKNRINYLHVTLKSLSSTKLLDSKIILVDDCSTNEDMKKYLFSDEIVHINPISWHNQIKYEFEQSGISYRKKSDKDKKIKILYNDWDNFIGYIPNDNLITGIKNKYSIIQPYHQMGDKLGLLWTINAGFTLFKNAEYIVILNDDIIFNKNWLDVINLIYDKESNTNLGLISIYNYNNKINNNKLLYSDVQNIDEIMYVIPKSVYNLMKKQKCFDINDKNIENLFLQNFIIKNKLRILNTSSSYIQHIGINSISLPGKFFKFSKNFLGPYTWDKSFDNRKL